VSDRQDHPLAQGKPYFSEASEKTIVNIQSVLETADWPTSEPLPPLAAVTAGKPTPQLNRYTVRLPLWNWQIAASTS
jgi:hypothetical protein